MTSCGQVHNKTHLKLLEKCWKAQLYLHITNLQRNSDLRMMQLNMGLDRHHSTSEKQWRTLHGRLKNAMRTLKRKCWPWVSTWNIPSLHTRASCQCWNRPQATDGHGDKTVIKGSDASASAIVANARVQLCANSNIQERKTNSSRRCSTLLIFTRHAVVGADFCEQSLVSPNKSDQLGDIRVATERGEDRSCLKNRPPSEDTVPNSLTPYYGYCDELTVQHKTK